MTTKNPTYLLATGLSVLAVLMLFYIITALGLIADEGDPADIVYVGVVGVGLLGALLARFRPMGMAVALSATTLMQVCVTAVVTMIGVYIWPPFTVLKVLALNDFFAAMFGASAFLFWRASRPGRTA